MNVADWPADYTSGRLSMGSFNADRGISQNNVAFTSREAVPDQTRINQKCEEIKRVLKACYGINAETLSTGAFVGTENNRSGL
jgi:hypothetical protein